MARRVPSIRTIERMLNVNDVQAKEIRRLMEAGTDGQLTPRGALREINRVMDLHGVESFQDAESWYDTISYVNTGDSYEPTILHDTRTDLFYATSWGDYVESWERRGRQFA